MIAIVPDAAIGRFRKAGLPPTTRAAETVCPSTDRQVEEFRRGRRKRAMHDLVIRGATVVDGLGHDPIRADVAVKDGRIAAIGAVDNEAAETVDAGGLALMPGIIDIHTHYDAQITWD